MAYWFLHAWHRAYAVIVSAVLVMICLLSSCWYFTEKLFALIIENIDLTTQLENELCHIRACSNYWCVFCLMVLYAMHIGNCIGHQHNTWARFDICRGIMKHYNHHCVLWAVTLCDMHNDNYYMKWVLPHNKLEQSIWPICTDWQVHQHVLCSAWQKGEHHLKKSY